MTTSFAPGARRVPAGLLMAVLSAWTLCNAALGSEGLQVVRVEEDWALVVGAPDPDSVAPQVTACIFPLGSADAPHVTFELNHQSVPQFAAGGLNLHLWNGEQYLGTRNSVNRTVLATTGETIVWTQAASLAEGTLRFQIVSGESLTWEDFGGEGFTLSTPTSLTNLNAYTPNLSVANSGVGFASNRVRSLTLTEVRLYLADGQVLTDETPRVAYPKP